MSNPYKSVDPSWPAPGNGAQQLSELTRLRTYLDETVGKLNSLVDTVQDLRPRILDLEVGHGDQMNNYLSMASRYQGLADRVEQLEATVDALTAPPQKPVDDVNELVLAYMRDKLPNQWTTPTAVGTNIGIQPSRVDGRMLRMSRDGVIERKGGQGAGSRPLYRFVVPTEDQP